MHVAMKDLEIRGAGNLLGGEQSGHIAAVGFDLYVRLVGEAVSELQGRGPGGPRRGPGRAAGRRAPAARLHARRAAAAGGVPTDRRDRLRRRRRRGPRRADRPLRRAAGARPRLLEVARLRARARAPGSPTSRCRAATSASRRWNCPIPGRSGCSGCTRGHDQAGGAYDAGAGAEGGTRVVGVRAAPGASRGRSVASGPQTVIGGQPLRDRDMLAWCTGLIDAVFGEPAQVSDKA